MAGKKKRENKKTKERPIKYFHTMFKKIPYQTSFFIVILEQKKKYM